MTNLMEKYQQLMQKAELIDIKEKELEQLKLDLLNDHAALAKELGGGFSPDTHKIVTVIPQNVIEPTEEIEPPFNVNEFEAYLVCVHFTGKVDITHPLDFKKFDKESEYWYTAYYNKFRPTQDEQLSWSEYTAKFLKAMGEVPYETVKPEPVEEIKPESIKTEKPAKPKKAANINVKRPFESMPYSREGELMIALREAEKMGIDARNGDKFRKSGITGASSIYQHFMRQAHANNAPRGLWRRYIDMLLKEL